MYIKRPFCILAVAFSLLIFIFVNLFPKKLSPGIKEHDGDIICVSGRV